MQSDKSERSEASGAERPSAGEKTDPSTALAESSKHTGISAVAVLWTFGKCLGALLPVYLAGYYRVSTSLLVFGMMIYTGWKHAREAKEARLKSAIQLHSSEEEFTSMNKIKRDLPAWVRSASYMKIAPVYLQPTLTCSNPTHTARPSREHHTLKNNHKHHLR